MKKIKTKLSIIVAILMSLFLIQTANAGPKGDTIVDVAIAVNASGPYAGQFDTLIAALGAADPIVLEKLSGNGQFTVFAPTDSAFNDLGLDDTNIDTLPQDVLTEILLYHVLRGRRYEEAVLMSSQLNTLLKRNFIYQFESVLTDNLGREANFVLTNVEAANGVIHVIDAVVLPYSPE